jgi:hypothetical protein
LSDETDSLIVILLEEHGRIQDLLWRLQTVEAHQRAALFGELASLVVAHEIAEELVIYPYLRHISGGAEVADERILEQHRAEDHLVVVDQIDPLDERFLEEAAVLEHAIVQHAGREEVGVLPLLELHATLDELSALGVRFRAESRALAAQLPSLGAQRAGRAQLAEAIDAVRDFANVH